MRLPDLRAAGSASTAIALLARAGWHEIGRGDWSWVYAEQDSELAVRISPWDPAYALHVQQCVDHSGNPYLQRIHHIDALGAAREVLVNIPDADQCGVSHMSFL